MQATYWIDRVKSHKGLPSDYAVAKELGLTRSAVSSYRHKGFATLDEDACVKVGLVLGIDPLVVVADQARERAKNDEARSAWSAILDRLGGVAASIFLTAGMVGGIGAAPDAHSATRSQNSSGPTVENLYIVSINIQTVDTEKITTTARPARAGKMPLQDRTYHCPRG